MSSPCQYFGRTSHMSFVLKQDIKRVRAAKPQYYASRQVRETNMDGEGKVTATERTVTAAVPLSPARRHALSFQRARF